MSHPLLSLASFTARALPTCAKRALYCLGPLSNLIRQGLNQAAPTDLTEVTVATGGLKGMQLSLDLQTEKDYWLCTYELALQAAIQDFVQPDMVAYDVGANIGYITLLLARAVGETDQVFAFEALPANLERLRADVALNGPASQVQIVHGAVIDHSRPVTFLAHASTGMGKPKGSAGRAANYQDVMTIPGVTLDDFVYVQGHPAPQVVKIDVEGGEVLTPPGMQRTLEEARPTLFLELHGKQAAKISWETLTDARYHLYRMETGYPPITNLASFDWKSNSEAKPT